MNHLIFCHPLLLLPSIFPSIKVFSNESVLCIRWPKYWSFSFSISPSNEYSEPIPFRMDWLDHLAVQRASQESSPTPQFKSIGSSALSLFTVQLSHPYTTIGKTIALTVWTHVGKVVSLLFNTLARCVVTFLPRSTRLLIPWLQSPSAMILEPKKIVSVVVPIVSPSICQKVSSCFRRSFRTDWLGFYCKEGRSFSSLYSLFIPLHVYISMNLLTADADSGQ